MKIFETKVNEDDLYKINEVLLTGQLGFGENVSLFERKFASFSNKKYNVATNSASAAAFMIFAYLRHIHGRCDVYTTSLGFTSPAWAAKHFGHNLIFVDVNDELQFDVEDYKTKRNIRCEKYINAGTKIVVMPVLYGGVSNIVGFDSFFDNSEYSEIIVVDSAHCVTPTIKSNFTFFSFHPYKPICTSDGGMISTNDTESNEYFRSYRNFGRKQVDNSYDIEQEGFKFYMNNLNATIGLTQIEKYHENVAMRKVNYQKLSQRYDLLPHDEKSSFYFATTLTKHANDIMVNMRLSRHYPMLHKMEYYGNDQKLKNLELLHNKILNLPLYNENFLFRRH